MEAGRSEGSGARSQAVGGWQTYSRCRIPVASRYRFGRTCVGRRPKQPRQAAMNRDRPQVRSCLESARWRWSGCISPSPREAASPRSPRAFLLLVCGRQGRPMAPAGNSPLGTDLRLARALRGQNCGRGEASVGLWPRPPRPVPAQISRVRRVAGGLSVRPCVEHVIDGGALEEGRQGPDVIERLVVVILSGIIAEYMFTGRMNWRGSETDLPNAKQLVAGLVGTKDQRAAYLELLWIRARDQLQLHWPAVVEVARRLADHADLTGNQVCKRSRRRPRMSAASTPLLGYLWTGAVSRGCFVTGPTARVESRDVDLDCSHAGATRGVPHGWRHLGPTSSE